MKKGRMEWPKRIAGILIAMSLFGISWKIPELIFQIAMGAGAFWLIWTGRQR